MSPQRFPVGSSEPARFANPGHGSDADSPPTSNRKSGLNTRGAARRYITKQAVRDTAGRLSERDHQLLLTVAHLHLVAGQQLRRLYYSDSEAGRRLARLDLARLVKWRVLARLSRRIGGERAGSEGYVYALDVIGQRIVHPGPRRYRAPRTAGLPFVAHVVAVSELYVELWQQSRRQDFVLLRFDAEPACWRQFHGPGGRRLVLKPDAFVISASGDYEDRHFVEVDRGTESLPRITGKAKIYLDYWQSGREQETDGVYPRVLWIAPDEERRSQLVEALSGVQPKHWRLFATSTSDRAADCIAGGSAS